MDLTRKKSAMTGEHIDDLPQQRIIGMEEVSAMTGTPINTLRFWRQRGVGPKSGRFGRRVVYREVDVRAWIDAQFESAS